MGGLVGANNSFRKQQLPVIRFCYAKVTVASTAPTDDTLNSGDNNNPFNIKYGGLVGCNETGATYDSYATGNVSGGDRVGGLAGCTIDGVILRCYATGNVTQGISSSAWEGGIGHLVGRVDGKLPPGLGGYNGSGAVGDSFYESGSTLTSDGGPLNDASGTGITGDAWTQNTFTAAGWDPNVWDFTSGYPIQEDTASAEYEYQTYQAGNWSTLATWEYKAVGSDTWLKPASVYPDFANSVSITILHDVTVDVDVTIDQTTIASGKTLTVATDNILTVSKGVTTDLVVNGSLVVNGTLFTTASAVVSSTTTTFTVDGYKNVDKYLDIAENTVLITGFSSSTTVPAESIFPAFVNRTWTISGGFTGTKNVTFTWTADDDGGYPWSSSDQPAVYINDVMQTGIPWNSAEPRKITLSVDSFAARGEYKIGRAGGGTLPVELSSFTAMVLGSGRVRLDWVTYSETNVNGYYLWRSPTDNLYHAEIVSPLIGAANTSNTMVYSFEDRELSSDGEYRYWLQNVDFDGTTDYHGPISITVSFANTTAPQIPLNTELSSLYPNPFNPELRVSYALKATSDVRIDVLNIRGQVLRNLHSAKMDAGRYTLIWDGKDNDGNSCAAGIFFIRMTTDRESFTRKAIMMK